MAEEEVVDAESGTLNKQTTPLEHLKHLMHIGWSPDQPLVQNFVEKYGLERELKELLDESSVH